MSPCRRCPLSWSCAGRCARAPATPTRTVAATAGSPDGLLLSSPLVPKNGGELREVSWFLCGCPAEGSSPRPRDVLGESRVEKPTIISSLSPSTSADGLHQKTTPPASHFAQSVTVQTCITMLTNVGPLRRGQPLTRSSLPSSLHKPHEWPTRKRRLESLPVFSLAQNGTGQNRGGMEAGPSSSRRKRTRTGPCRSGESWQASTPSSASRPSSSRIGYPPPRFSVTLTLSTSSWPLQRCQKASSNCWRG